MKIFNNLNEIKLHSDTCIALGRFDGVHSGHANLIKEMVKKSKENDCLSVVFSFSKEVFKAGRSAVPRITLDSEKARLIEEIGVDVLVNIPFDENIKNLNPEAFINEVLVKKLCAKNIFCGFNYKFGKNASGTPSLLSKIGKEKGFSVEILPPYSIGKEIVSSSAIRDFIENGDIEKCNCFLGRNFSVEGTVVRGNQIGNTIGFATANIDICEDMAGVPNGVYVTKTRLNGKVFPSITNVGNKPTIGEYCRNIETHIFNYDEILYGVHLKVEFLKKIREEKKFSGLAELKASIEKDCKTAKEYHLKNKDE